MHIILHVGMHKTASTYIQKMLEENIELLKLHNIEYPYRSRALLAKSIRSRTFDPWMELVEQSKPTSTILISEERLSNVLAQQQNDRLIVSNGDWLAKKLKPHCANITIIGFVRDQPGFINSQFCQSTKRFNQNITADFNTFIKDVFSGKHEMIECNPQKLFGWSLKNKLVETIFIPFNNSSKNDPFQQLIHNIVPNIDISSWKQVKAINQTPGRLTIHMACKINKYLRRKKLCLTQKERLYLSYLLIEKTDSLGWNAARYNAITSKRYALIRDHYRIDNNKFASNAWNVDKWDDLFPSQKQCTTNYKINISDYLRIKREAKEFIKQNLVEKILDQG